MPVRVYTPDGSIGRCLVLVYLHGGGWVLCSLETHDNVCPGHLCVWCRGRSSCRSTIAWRPRIVSRPAIDDLFAAAGQWVAGYAVLASTATRARIVIAGDSAGGNLAAAVALTLRDTGGPRLAYQLLIYPVTDHNFLTRSYVENGEGYRLTRSAMEHYWKLYLGSEGDADDQRASPLRAASLANLPPACVATAGEDVLFEHALKEANDMMAVFQDQPILRRISAKRREAELLIEGPRRLKILDRQAD